MSASMPGEATGPKQMFNLSELLGRPVLAAGGHRVGTVDEFVIVDKDSYAEVTHLVVRRPFGRPPLVVRWDQVAACARKVVILDCAEDQLAGGALPPSAILLKDFILDKKVLDRKGRDLEVVYDLGLTVVEGRLLVVDVDLTRGALLRRLHLTSLAKVISRSGGSGSNRIPWRYVAPLPLEMGSFQGAVRLKVLREQLVNLPPVDLADILEKLGHEERMAVFGELDVGRASDLLEALDPKVQRDLVASLDKARTAGLVDEMTPAQAADLLAILPWWEVRELIDLIARYDEEKAHKIKAILTRQEEKAIDFASAAFVHFTADQTVARVRSALAAAAGRKVDFTYVYVVDADSRLIGVVDSKALLVADWDRTLQAIMTANVVSLTPQSTLRQASTVFARYLFRALPITDDDGKMVGLLSYRDVVSLQHRFVE